MCLMSSFMKTGELKTDLSLIMKVQGIKSILLCLFFLNLLDGLSTLMSISQIIIVWKEAVFIILAKYFQT